MNNSNEERLKIAVFVDFDNIAIGVKQSMGRNFDIGTVLEAIKEKGQVISKTAYSDWKRNGGLQPQPSPSTRSRWSSAT